MDNSNNMKREQTFGLTLRLSRTSWTNSPGLWLYSINPSLFSLWETGLKANAGSTDRHSVVWMIHWGAVWLQNIFHELEEWALRFLVWGHLKSQDQTSLMESPQEVIAKSAIRERSSKFLPWKSSCPKDSICIPVLAEDVKRYLADSVTRAGKESRSCSDNRCVVPRLSLQMCFTRSVNTKITTQRLCQQCWQQHLNYWGIWKKTTFKWIMWELQHNLVMELLKDRINKPD